MVVHEESSLKTHSDLRSRVKTPGEYPGEQLKRVGKSVVEIEMGKIMSHCTLAHNRDSQICIFI